MNKKSAKFFFRTYAPHLIIIGFLLSLVILITEFKFKERGYTILSYFLGGYFSSPPTNCHVAEGEIFFQKRNQNTHSGILYSPFDISIPKAGTLVCVCDQFELSPTSKSNFICKRNKESLIFNIDCVHAQKPWRWDVDLRIKQQMQGFFTGKYTFDNKRRLVTITYEDFETLYNRNKKEFGFQ